jgi:hypothetical protein
MKKRKCLSFQGFGKRKKRRKRKRKTVVTR